MDTIETIDHLEETDEESSELDNLEFVDYDKLYKNGEKSFKMDDNDIWKIKDLFEDNIIQGFNWNVRTQVTEREKEEIE